MRVEKSFGFFAATVLAFGLLGCGGYNAPPQAPPSPASVTVSPASASVPAGPGTQSFTVTVMNDYLNRGVTWALSGSGCSGATCGSLSNVTTSSVTYNAPGAVPNPATVTLTATSVNDTTKQSSAAITVTPPALAGSSLVSLTVTDTPPAGITLLSFQVSITGAALNPGNVDLLAGKGPVRIEVKRLETDSAFLNTSSVAPGTYTSLNLTFANPELTFKNDTSAVAGCAVGAVCEIKPTGTLTATFTFPAPGITVSTSSPTGVQVDIHPSTILSSALGVDFSQTGAVNAQQLPLAGRNPGELDKVELKGVVQNLDTTNKKFTLRTSSGDFSITTDDNTKFEFESCRPLPNVFACIQNNQVVETEAKIMSGGVFLAKEIEFEDEAIDDEVEGVVSNITDATHFEMVALHERRDVANVSIGNRVVVTLDPAVKFRVQKENLDLTAVNTLRTVFESAMNTSALLVGQTVEIRVKGAATVGPPAAATADRVQLRTSQFTAKIKAGSIASPNFTVDNLPPYFTVGSILIRTQLATQFDGKATSFSSLADGDTVSLKGLLFKNGMLSPELLAKKVRKR